MDSTAYCIAYNVIYNKLKSQRISEQINKIVQAEQIVKETKL